MYSSRLATRHYIVLTMHSHIFIMAELINVSISSLIKRTEAMGP